MVEARVTLITPVWVGTDLRLLEDRNVPLVGMAAFGYVGPRVILEEIQDIHSEDDEVLLLPFESENVARKRNRLLDWATSKYVMQADDDDLIDPAGLAEVLRIADLNPRFGGVFGGCVNVDEHGRPARFTGPPQVEGTWTNVDLLDFWETSRTRKHRRGYLPFHMGAGVMRTDTVMQVGGWRADVNDGRYGEDLPLAVAVARELSIHTTPKPVMKYRQRPGSLATQGTDARHWKLTYTMRRLRGK